jgi:release factor glutamine methyltransferase
MTGRESVVAALASALSKAGCVAPEEEAAELLEAAGGDARRLGQMLERRVSGEPLAWVTGSVYFCGLRVLVRSGVYVPRWQSEPLALRAAQLLPERGLAVDLACGSGAIARVMASSRPHARVLATDIDPLACECAGDNGIPALVGHLAAPLPAEVRGRADVVTAVPPYVPTAELAFLPRDVRDHEPMTALDGGPDGARLLVEVVRAAAGVLHPGGTLLVELGGDQDRLLGATLRVNGFRSWRPMRDDEGDLRGLEALKGG